MTDQPRSRQWRFWPISILAFFYPINNALINLAIPLYYSNIGESADLIGIVSAAISLTYIFSPVLLNKFSDKIGRKKCIILSMTGVFFAQILFYFSLNPIVVLISRLIEGFSMGLFWPNLQASISDNILHNHNRMISRYNISWNFGLLSGHLFGTIFLYIIDEVQLIFYIAPIFIALNILIAVIIYQDPEKIDYKSNSANFEKLNESSSRKKAISPIKYSIPLILPTIFAFVHGIAKSNVYFLYPIKSVFLSFDTYTVYFYTFLSITTQLISTGISSYIKIKNFKWIAPTSMLVLAITLFLFGFLSEFIIFSLLFMSLGFFSGLVYGFSLKLMLNHNMQKNTSKYTSWLESIIGSAFFLSPVISGYIATFCLDCGFYTFSIVILVLLFISIFYFRKMAPAAGFEPASQE